MLCTLSLTSYGVFRDRVISVTAVTRYSSPALVSIVIEWLPWLPWLEYFQLASLGISRDRVTAVTAVIWVLSHSQRQTNTQTNTLVLSLSHSLIHNEKKNTLLRFLVSCQPSVNRVKSFSPQIGPYPFRRYLLKILEICPFFRMLRS